MNDILPYTHAYKRARCNSQSLIGSCWIDSCRSRRIKLLTAIFFITTILFAGYSLLTNDETDMESEPRLHLAKRCRESHKIHTNAYRSYDNVPILLFYHAFLPSGGNARPIVSAQLQALERSGLLHRHYVRLHIALTHGDASELAWFKSLEILHGELSANIRFVTSSVNRWEFPGMRWAWEASCDAEKLDFSPVGPQSRGKRTSRNFAPNSEKFGKPRNNETLVMYFHSKGSSHGSGRLPVEKRLTDEFVVGWREMVSLFAAMHSIDTLGLGGPSWQWYTFWWARASYLRTHSPKPVLTDNRWYYEEWIGLLSPNVGHGECSSKTGIELALESDPLVPYKEGTYQKRKPSYSTIRCGHLSVSPEDASRTVELPDLKDPISHLTTQDYSS